MVKLWSIKVTKLPWEYGVELVGLETSRMNIHIGDYDVDSIILDLGLDVKILTK